VIFFQRCDKYLKAIGDQWNRTRGSMNQSRIPN
jgi:hypothetical protein